jgi:hypothetical protein
VRKNPHATTYKTAAEKVKEFQSKVDWIESAKGKENLESVKHALRQEPKPRCGFSDRRFEPNVDFEGEINVGLELRTSLRFEVRSQKLWFHVIEFKVP